MTDAVGRPTTAASRWATLDVETDGLRYTRLDLDGHSVLNAARSMTITCDPDDLPTVEIELRCEAYRMHSDRTRVELFMPDEVRDLLVRRGWTPPPDEDA